MIREYNIREEQEEAAIQRYINDPNLLPEQRETLKKYDRYLFTKSKVKQATRKSRIQSAKRLGIDIKKPFEQITSADIEEHIYNWKKQKGSIRNKIMNTKNFHILIDEKQPNVAHYWENGFVTNTERLRSVLDLMIDIVEKIEAYTPSV